MTDTRENYDDIKRMNASTIVHGMKSMWALRCAIDGGFKSSPAMEFGSQYHCLILEPEEFERTHAVMPNFSKHEDNVDGKGGRSESGNTLWAKRRKAQFFSDCRDEGREIITQENYDKAQQMIAAIRRNKVATEVLRTSTKEVTLLGEIGGVEFKGRVDLLGPTILADIKGTPDATDHTFGRSMANINTVFKMSIYRELLRQSQRDPEEVLLIAVESSGFFDSCVYSIPEEALDDGFRKVERVVERYKRCIERDKWPGLQDGMSSPMPLFVPLWAMPDDEEFSWKDIDV